MTSTAAHIELVGHSLAMLTIESVMMGLAIIAVALRCFVRLYIVRSFGWDDSVMVGALVIFIGLCVCSICGAKDGVGHRLVDFGTDVLLLEKALRWWWLSQILYIWASAAAKISIALALLRLAVKRWQRNFLYCLIGLALVIALLFFFVLTFDCHPVSYFWKQADPYAKGHCTSVDVLLIIAYLYSGLTIVVDFSLGGFPLLLVWNLQMNSRTKVAVSGILSLGAVASIAVVIRMPFLKHYEDTDFLYSTYQIAIWTIIETGLSIIAGSLITLRPLFRWFLDGSRYGPSKPYIKSNTPKYPLASLESVKLGDINLKRSSNDPKFWRPDIKESHNMVTSVSSPEGPRSSHSNSSEEPLDPSHGTRYPYRVNVHETITVEERRGE
ncbi:uncharacterized protein N7483_006926 [Penicillium malachiteum]|uniref:uncharacterized protein n=1 Tax=Penicillium malachiteum TaxID=1324776 RepID=UPI002546B1F7|nr:uncharacterized protein N7483_006926 [Penicillium malachiteum]KAJ5725569.1 hypothetical protein N7483_006926 [Penicillium malachiteum]